MRERERSACCVALGVRFLKKASSSNPAHFLKPLFSVSGSGSANVFGFWCQAVKPRFYLRIPKGLTKFKLFKLTLYYHFVYDSR